MYKQAWCTCKVVDLLIKPIAFLTFSLPSSLLHLKVPNSRTQAINKGRGTSEVSLVIKKQQSIKLRPTDYKSSYAARLLFKTATSSKKSLRLTIKKGTCLNRKGIQSFWASGWRSLKVHSSILWIHNTTYWKPVLTGLTCLWRNTDRASHEGRLQVLLHLVQRANQQ